ncbi:MAG: TonB-dependent receptor [Tannerellaceae bacterium]|nr:TonB-dependent receptor [Tannerellaceae bacterium]
MSRISWILLMVFSLPVFLYSQREISIHLSERPVLELFTQIEQQTGYKIFCEMQAVDSLIVSVDCRNCLPVDILREVFQNTPLKVSEFKEALFMHEIEFVTNLPEGYFAESRGSTGEAYDMSGILLGSRREQKATSEHKVYEIGDPTQTAEGRVVLTGHIKDFKSGEPMAGVALFIREPLIATTTDGFGYYSIQLPPRRHELFIQGMGMKDTRRQIQLYGGGKLDIELEEQVYTLKEVTVSSERIANVRGTTMGVERLKIKEMKNIPTAFGEVDILRVVMSLPGVKSVGEASSGFNVRGGATDQNLILFNDGTIYNPTHLFGFFSAFNPDVIKDMELYKSSIPAQYGGRLSSVLDINSREGNKKEFNGSASIGLLTSQLTFEGPIYMDKTSFIVSGRTTYSDWILKKLPEKSEYSDGTAGFYDLNASVNHKFNAYNNLYINGYFSHDRFNFNKYEHYSYQNANASVKWRHIFSPQLASTFTAGYDHYDYYVRNTDNPVEAYKLKFGINQYFGKADFAWYVSDKHTVDFGASGLIYNLSPGEYLPYSDESYVVPDYMQKRKPLKVLCILATSGT